MFWLMFLTGGASLAACVILPAWLEHQAALEAVTDARGRVERLQRRLEVYDKQIEHLQVDDAYLERLARKEFDLPSAGVTTVRIESESADESAADVDRGAAAAGEPFPELSAFVERALARYPLTRVFVFDQTRPIVMAMSGGLVLASMLLLGHSARRGV